ncbi:transglutaminase domain-containing protein [Cohnella sp. JJ-181]|uniref:transglutaminase domain-containing protein n=1 Tax=Cohnella rhizoplanae TaxID=2974897 RepID=UPI0022FF9F30|nr:transglutaminase-like domain-containing protein [Cohnella sp. JJ-181]CAI6039318.1 hypothetical protein COHCIP112018_01019 [Cohnella sp. JJ-181]
MSWLDGNFVTLALLALVAVSLLQGMRRGAKGSAKQLFLFLSGAILTLLAMGAAAWCASAASPAVQRWLEARSWAMPAADASTWRQLGYTAFSGVRDLPLLRFAVLFLIAYLLLRSLLGTVSSLLIRVGAAPFVLVPGGGPVSRTVGGLIGAALGGGRAILVTAVLFAYCALSPQSVFAQYIEQSGLYREAAAQIIKPAAGDLLTERLPVLAASMQGEMDKLWQKRYDIIDADLPTDIVSAAKEVTAGADGDEAKARALYEWVGTRVAYDNGKAEAYEQRGEWREQSPEDTFRTREGVCIDYARLYAAMARSVGLNVRVVTGQGYDGQGGYGPHAWNEVLLGDRGAWIPLDSTWARTGDWFNPPRFDDTHIRSA